MASKARNEMYEELIKNLRICSRCDFGQDCNGCTQERTDTFCCDKLLHDAANAIEKLIEDRDMYAKAMTDEHNRAARLAWDHRWIPVTERLPKDGAEVLAFNRTGFAYVDYRADGKWKINSMVDEEHEIVTHWMPLPEPPKDGES